MAKTFLGYARENVTPDTLEGNSPPEAPKLRRRH